MASKEIMIEGLPMDDSDRNLVHPAIGELFFNTHHDYNPSNPDAMLNKGHFNLKHEAVDFILSLRSLKVRQAMTLTPQLLIEDFLPRI